MNLPYNISSNVCYKMDYTTSFLCHDGRQSRDERQHERQDERKVRGAGQVGVRHLGVPDHVHRQEVGATRGRLHRRNSIRQN